MEDLFRIEIGDCYYEYDTDSRKWYILHEETSAYSRICFTYVRGGEITDKALVFELNTLLNFELNTMDTVQFIINDIEDLVQENNELRNELANLTAVNVESNIHELREDNKSLLEQLHEAQEEIAFKSLQISNLLKEIVYDQI